MITFREQKTLTIPKVEVFHPQEIKAPAFKTVQPDRRPNYSIWQRYLSLQRYLRMKAKGSDVFGELYNRQLINN